jgi:hypothetical protein
VPIETPTALWAGEEAYEVWPSYSEGTSRDLVRTEVIRNRMKTETPPLQRSEFPTARSLSTGQLQDALEKVKRMRVSSQ